MKTTQVLLMAIVCVFEPQRASPNMAEGLEMNDQLRANIEDSVDNQDSPAILYGESVSGPANYPWIAALYKDETTGKSLICGGSLIRADFVVTAAQCITDGSSTSHNSTGYIRNITYVKLGGTNREYLNDSTAQHFQVTAQNVYRHPSYTMHVLGAYTNDIALMKLNPAAVPDAYIQPIMLPIAGVDYEGRSLEILGWGKTEQNLPSEVLMKASVTMHQSTTCSAQYALINLPKLYLVATMICYGGLGDPNICRMGDIGAGVITSENGVQILLSLNSYIHRKLAAEGRVLEDSNAAQGRQGGSFGLQGVIQGLGRLVLRQKFGEASTPGREDENNDKDGDSDKDCDDDDDNHDDDKKDCDKTTRNTGTTRSTFTSSTTRSTTSPTTGSTTSQTSTTATSQTTPSTTGQAASTTSPTTTISTTTSPTTTSPTTTSPTTTSPTTTSPTSTTSQTTSTTTGTTTRPVPNLSDCTKTYPAVGTRISNYRTWIDGVLAKN